MPHCYSREAWARRRDRAIRRGYVEPRLDGYRYVLVESGFEEAVKAAYRSMRWHYVHDRMTGSVHHHGRLATLCAKRAGSINDSEFAEATCVHRKAGRLKHGVSRWEAKTVERRAACADKGRDFLYDSDPWANAHVGDVGAVCEGEGEARRQEPEDTWRAWRERGGRARQEEDDPECEADESRIADAAVDLTYLYTLLNIFDNEVARLRISRSL
jgi:hypothetical protein